MGRMGEGGKHPREDEKEPRGQNQRGPCTSAPPMMLSSRVGSAAFQAGCWPWHHPPGGTRHPDGAGRRHQRVRMRSSLTEPSKRGSKVLQLLPHSRSSSPGAKHLCFGVRIQLCPKTFGITG